MIYYILILGIIIGVGYVCYKMGYNQCKTDQAMKRDDDIADIIYEDGQNIVRYKAKKNPIDQYYLGYQPNKGNLDNPPTGGSGVPKKR